MTTTPSTLSAVLSLCEEHAVSSTRLVNVQGAKAKLQGTPTLATLEDLQAHVAMHGTVKVAAPKVQWGPNGAVLTTDSRVVPGVVFALAVGVGAGTTGLADARAALAKLQADAAAKTQAQAQDAAAQAQATRAAEAERVNRVAGRSTRRNGTPEAVAGTNGQAQG